MAVKMEIKPFQAYRFDEAMVGDAGSCIAPPYDVISPEQQNRLYQKSEYNIVRITKGKTTSADSDTENQYTRASEYLNKWFEKGILKQDPIETIYAYVQDFQVAGAQFQRFSFIALAKLEEFGEIVRPHEETLDQPRVDRLNLKRATSAKLGLVFMLYEDEKNVADKIIEKTVAQKPLIDFVDDGEPALQVGAQRGVRHRLFTITAQEDINAITKMMADKSCIIADGHHRYETGLLYAKETNKPTARYQMIAFANTRHDGLVILANHRLVNNLKGFDFEKLITDLEENFEVKRYHFDLAEAKPDAKKQMLAQMKTEYENDKNAFGIYGGNNCFYVVVLKDKKAMDMVTPHKSSAWKGLDVSVLHKLVLEKLLGIGEKELAKGSNVEYVKGAENSIDGSIEKVDSGQKQIAFFMNPAKMQQLKMVTDAGEKMPQKSTYFYPKVYTGLTINRL